MAIVASQIPFNNSTNDIRSKRQLNELTRELNFERVMRYGGTSADYSSDAVVYRTTVLDEEELNYIVSQLGAACDGWHIGKKQRITPDISIRLEARQDFNRIESIDIYQSTSIPHSPGKVLGTHIVVHMKSSIPIASRIFRWWPW